MHGNNSGTLTTYPSTNTEAHRLRSKPIYVSNCNADRSTNVRRSSNSATNRDESKCQPIRRFGRESPAWPARRRLHYSDNGQSLRPADDDPNLPKPRDVSTSMLFSFFSFCIFFSSVYCNAVNIVI